MSSATQLHDSDVLIQFDENVFEPVNAYQEDFEDQVHVAQEQLAALREKQEQLERQKRELEELQEKKKGFTEGRTRLVKEIGDYVALLERESAEAIRKSEQCLDTRDLLDHQLRVLQSLRPEQWGRAELAQELSRAIESIEAAEDELSDAEPFLHSLKMGGPVSKGSGLFGKAGGPLRRVGSGAVAAVNAPQGFSYWFKSGLAFTLPLMIVAGVVGLIMLMLGGG